MYQIAQRLVHRSTIHTERAYQVNIKNEPPQCGTSRRIRGIQFVNDHLAARVGLPVDLNPEREVAVRSAATVIMQGESVRRCAAPPALGIVPLDDPPVVVAIQRANALR